MAQLLFYPIAPYSISVAGYVLYYLQTNSTWFDVAYATNLGGLFMNMVAFIFLISEHFSKQRSKDDLILLRMVFNLLAICMFGGNALALFSQLGFSRPQLGIAPWISGVGLMSILFPEMLSLLQKNHPQERARETLKKETVQ